MAGHSKWANIKHKKQKTDAQKGKIFTKIGREIAIVVKQGGPDPEVNSKLKDVIAKAKAANMPNETIMRSIKRPRGKSIPPIMKKWCMKAMAPAVWPLLSKLRRTTETGLRAR